MEFWRLCFVLLLLLLCVFQLGSSQTATTDPNEGQLSIWSKYLYTNIFEDFQWYVYSLFDWNIMFWWTIAVSALNKIVDHWNLRRYLNLSTDPCNKNAKWAPESANPRIACDCAGDTCHITHLSVYRYSLRNLSWNCNLCCWQWFSVCIFAWCGQEDICLGHIWWYTKRTFWAKEAYGLVRINNPSTYSIT